MSDNVVIGGIEVYKHCNLWNKVESA